MDPEELWYFIDLADIAKRYEDHAQFSFEYSQCIQEELSNADCSKLFYGYLNLVNNLRSYIRTIQSLPGERPQLLGEQQQKIKDLWHEQKIMLSRISSKWITPESKRQWLNQKVKIYRWLHEVDPERFNDKFVRLENELAEMDRQIYSPTSGVYLGMALSRAVWAFEIEHDTVKAIQIAQTAFDDAIPLLEDLEEVEYTDATCLLQLLRDNLTQWTA